MQRSDPDSKRFLSRPEVEILISLNKTAAIEEYNFRSPEERKVTNISATRDLKSFLRGRLRPPLFFIAFNQFLRLTTRRRGKVLLGNRIGVVPPCSSRPHTTRLELQLWDSVSC
jgi:hypothetical protein